MISKCKIILKNMEFFCVFIDWDTLRIIASNINKESEGSNGQEMIPIGNDFEADVLLIQIHDHKMEKDL